MLTTIIPQNKHNQVLAISGQIKRRLEQNISSVLPILHGISSLLDNQPHLLLNLPGSMSEFSSVLEVITGQISSLSLITHSDRNDFGATSHIESHEPGPAHLPSTAMNSRYTQSQANSTKHLRPPSPESKQKHKKSYGVL